MIPFVLNASGLRCRIVPAILVSFEISYYADTVMHAICLSGVADSTGMGGIFELASSCDYGVRELNPV